MQATVEEKLHYRLSLSTVHDILKRREEWMSSTSLSRCRVNFTRRGYVEFETEMLKWCHGWVRPHGTLTYACLMEKGKKRQTNWSLTPSAALTGGLVTSSGETV